MVLLLPATLSALIGGGFAAPVVYFVASERWKESEIVSRVFGLAIYLTSFMFAVGAIVVLSHDRLFPGVPERLLTLSLLLVPLQLFRSLFLAIIAGKQSFRLSMIESMIMGPLQLGLTILLVGILGLRIEGAIAAALIGGTVSLVVCFVLISKLLGASNAFVLPNLGKGSLSEAFSYGARSHLANVAVFLNYKLDFFLVNSILGQAPVGVYSVATGLAEKAWLPIKNLAAVIFPKSAYESRTDTVDPAVFVAKVASISLWLLAGATLIAAMICRPVIEFVYGTDFAEAGTIIVALLPGIAAMGHAKILANHLAGIGRPGLNSIAAIIGVIVNVALNLMLLPAIGILGAAIATSVSYSTISIIVYICFIKFSSVRWWQPLLPNGADLQLLARTGYRLATRMIGQSASSRRA